MDWRSQAACLTVDPELFFPVGNTGPAIAQIAEAKEVCARCEVIDTCLKWALENGQDAGVWGGMSEDERRSLKRRAAPAAPPDGPLPGRSERTERQTASKFRFSRSSTHGARPCAAHASSPGGRQGIPHYFIVAHEGSRRHEIGNARLVILPHGVQRRRHPKTSAS